jgi:hypothetical protein
MVLIFLANTGNSHSCSIVLVLALMSCELGSTSRVFGQDPSAKPTMNVELDSQNAFISVTFEGGKPLKSKALDATEWRVVAIPHDRNATPILLTLVKPEFYKRPYNGTEDKAQVRLKSPGVPPVPKDLELIVVEYDPGGLALSAMWKSPAKNAGNTPTASLAVKQNPDRLVAASSKQTAAIYFSGLYSPAIGSPPFECQ